jgi:hypothetical protein
LFDFEEGLDDLSQVSERYPLVRILTDPDGLIKEEKPIMMEEQRGGLSSDRVDKNISDKLNTALGADCRMNREDHKSSWQQLHYSNKKKEIEFVEEHRGSLPLKT